MNQQSVAGIVAGVNVARSCEQGVAVKVIEAVLFDWGGVLIENPAPRLMVYCAQALRVPLEDYTRVHQRHSDAFQEGRIDEAVFWQRVCRDLSRPVPARGSLWGDAFRAAYVPRQEVFGLARQLREKGHKTSLLSNTELPAMEFFLELRYDMFDALTFSCAEGTCKPRKEIYEFAARKLHAACGQCALIDDRLDFVAGARNAGMAGIVYENLGQVRQDLARLGVRVE